MASEVLLIEIGIERMKTIREKAAREIFLRCLLFAIKPRSTEATTVEVKARET